MSTDRVATIANPRDWLQTGFQWQASVGAPLHQTAVVDGDSGMAQADHETLARLAAAAPADYAGRS